MKLTARLVADQSVVAFFIIISMLLLLVFLFQPAEAFLFSSCSFYFVSKL